MKQIQLSSELIDLHDLSRKDLNTIKDHLENIIVSSCLNNLRDGEKEICIDIGIGDLIIRYYHDEILYGFLPANSLQQKLLGPDPLIRELGNKVDTCLKDIFRRILR